jgi:hypothetical protein
MACSSGNFASVREERVRARPFSGSEKSTLPILLVRMAPRGRDTPSISWGAVDDWARRRCQLLRAARVHIFSTLFRRLTAWGGMERHDFPSHDADHGIRLCLLRVLRRVAWVSRPIQLNYISQFWSLGSEDNLFG